MIDYAINARQAPSAALVEVVTNASLLFGWQLAGAAVSEAQLKATCADIGSVGHGKWVAEGLVPAAIRGEPYCDLSVKLSGSDIMEAPTCQVDNAPPNPTAAIPFIDYYNTEIFVTQILNAFGAGNVADLAYACKNLEPVLLTAFRLNATRVRTAVCSAAGIKKVPAPLTPIPDTSLTALATFGKDAATLYAYEFVSTATTEAEVKAICNDFPKYKANLAAQGLNADLIQSTMCAINTPLTVAQGTGNITEWSSGIFETVLGNVGAKDTWTQWLCLDLDAAAMTAVGLNGAAVKDWFCTLGGDTSP